MGAGQCLSIAPEIFELNDECQASVKLVNAGPSERVLLAQRSCPNNAIRVRRRFGESIPVARGAEVGHDKR